MWFNEIRIGKIRNVLGLTAVVAQRFAEKKKKNSSDRENSTDSLRGRRNGVGRSGETRRLLIFCLENVCHSAPTTTSRWRTRSVTSTRRSTRRTAQTTDSADYTSSRHRPSVLLSLCVFTVSNKVNKYFTIRLWVAVRNGEKTKKI